MRIFKWDQQFSPRKESEIAPVWIRIEGLPVYMFVEMPLLSDANAIGSPLRVHPLSVNRGEETTAPRVLDELPQPAQRKNKHGKKVAYAKFRKEKHGIGELNSQRPTTSSRGKSLQIDNRSSCSVSACTAGQNVDIVDLVNVAGQSSQDFQVPGHEFSAKSIMFDIGSNADMVQDVAQTAESSVSGQSLGKENYAAKVLDKLTESSSVSDLVPPLGDAFDMANLHGGQHGGEAVIDGGVNTIDTSDIQINKYEFHTPNMTWVEVQSLGKSEENGIIQGKYRGSDLIACQQKVDSFIKDVEDLKEKIDKVDSAIIDQIGKSSATKVFLKSHFERCILYPLPMTDLIDNEDKPDPCTKSELPEGGQARNMVSQDQKSLVTILSKLCYEQLSKSQGAQKWRTTVQIAPISEGPGIVKVALLQLGGKECVTEMRGGFPFDDKG
ncbi:hypothetical protein LIER_13496 [Lithospermum erythrorhizon]|uniref:DUF4283 domain-containing protein n=1 Tax=Lithospermum erythrorhizon TaxID=34254 RepID=A0AAV3Q084_LITER